MEKLGTIAFDRQFLQKKAHSENNPRLRTAFEIIESAWILEREKPLFALSGLGHGDVVVTGSRRCAYADKEVEALYGFVKRGGGLLIMSNHGSNPPGKNNDFAQFDRKLFKRFDLSLECTWFEEDDGSLIELKPSSDHPIFEAVDTIAVNNCSSIMASGETAVVRLPATLRDKFSGCSGQGRAFACALDSNQDFQGRGLFLTDSGFIGTEGTNRPGPGLIHKPDNKRFLRNTYEWLSFKR